MRRRIFGHGGSGITLGWIIEILRASLFPLDHAQAGRIVSDTAGADGHASDNLNIRVHFRQATINEAKFPVLLLKYRDVCISADRECTEVFPMNLVRRVHRRTAYEISK